MTDDKLYTSLSAKTIMANTTRTTRIIMIIVIIIIINIIIIILLFRLLLLLFIILFLLMRQCNIAAVDFSNGHIESLNLRDV